MQETSCSGADGRSFQRGALWLGLVLVLAGACGGKVSPEGDEPGSTPSDGEGTATSTDTDTDTESGGTTKPGQTPLGYCTPGFDPSKDPDRPCAWLAKKLCYDTKTAACACICPRDKQNSLCLSGFDDGPDGRVRVTCE